MRLYTVMRLSIVALARVRLAHWPAWRLGGFAFIVIELVAHFVLQLGGRPNFYNGLGQPEAHKLPGAAPNEWKTRRSWPGPVSPLCAISRK
jgi:hypothetical protein